MNQPCPSNVKYPNDPQDEKPTMVECDECGFFHPSDEISDLNGKWLCETCYNWAYENQKEGERCAKK